MYLSIHLFIYLSISHLGGTPPARELCSAAAGGRALASLYIYLCIYLSIYLSIYPSIYLSIYPYLTSDELLLRGSLAQQQLVVGLGFLWADETAKLRQDERERARVGRGGARPATEGRDVFREAPAFALWC